MSIRRRLEVLEGRVPAKQSGSEDRSEVRAWMRESLDYIARLRRSDSPEDQAELEAFREVFERERALRRGEGTN